MFLPLINRLGKNKLYVILVTLILMVTLAQWVKRYVLNEKVSESEEAVGIYDVKLESLNSLDKLSHYIDSMSLATGVGKESQEEYVAMIDGIIRQRFYHGKSEIDFGDNYIAWICGKLFWDDFAVGVTPNEILSHSKALCSQSAIVFQEIVKEKGFVVRAIGLNRHFCSEVFYQGSWHFMDSDMEPKFDKTRSIPSVEELSKDEELLKNAYVRDSPNVTIEQMEDMFNGKEIYFYNENQFPAKNMRVFQTLTKLLSDFLWLILALPIVFSFYNRRFA